MKTAQQAKVELKRRGYSYRTAAPLIGRSYQWISDVLNGHKASRPVIEAVFQLPVRNPKPQPKPHARQTVLAA